MRGYIFGLLILFVPSIAFASCLREGSTVLYINGINTSENKAREDLAALRVDYLQRTHDYKTIFLNGYNASHINTLGDKAKSFWQEGFSEGAVWTDYDLETILIKLHKDLSTQRVLLIGHSQGSYYSNQLYTYLTTHGADKNAVAVFNVATPARFVAGGGRHLNNSKDTLLNSLEASKLFKPLYRNIDLGEYVTEENLGVFLEDATSDWPGHSFAGAYLALAPDVVISNIKGGLTKLASSGTDKEECFSPPKDGLAYKTKQTFFVVADPAAVYTMQGLAVIGTGVVAVKDATVAAAGAAKSAFNSFVGWFVPAPRTENVPGSFSIVKSLYGSSLTEEEVGELLGNNQGASVANAAKPAPAPQKPQEEPGEVAGAETEQAPVVLPPQPIIPPPPAVAVVSPGYGGGGGGAEPTSAPAEEPTEQEEAASEPDEVEEEAPADTTAPVLATTTDMAVEATNQEGAVVAYAVPLATDNVDENISVSCVPAPGNIFAVGTTTVVCSAADAAGNSTTSTFNIIVAVPEPTEVIIASQTDDSFFCNDPTDPEVEGGESWRPCYTGGSSQVEIALGQLPANTELTSITIARDGSYGEVLRQYLWVVSIVCYEDAAYATLCTDWLTPSPQNSSVHTVGSLASQTDDLKYWTALFDDGAIFDGGSFYKLIINDNGVVIGAYGSPATPYYVIRGIATEGD